MVVWPYLGQFLEADAVAAVCVGGISHPDTHIGISLDQVIIALQCQLVPVLVNRGQATSQLIYLDAPIRKKK